MAKRGKSFVVGARGSRLSRIQTQGAVEFLARAFLGTAYRVVPVETPGDRDLTTPIEASAPDFFTRDLDDAVRDGRIDFAVHSAKDLPETIADDLDWFWLPNREDPRDCWVVRAGGAHPRAPRIGVSSERRRAYAARCYPKGRLLPIRGAIDARIRQLAEGRYDAVLMAMAGLKRLYPEGLPQGVEARPIPLDELEPPEAQGYLAVVFRAGDARLVAMRQKFVKAVRFVSAGVGDAGLCTVAGARDISLADVVLYDDLMGQALIDQRRGASAAQRLIHVGKRCGAHAMKQPEITRLICDEARRGRRVVRLKGGDAGLFGRLAEETDALAALGIPFLVRPGVSALTAGTTGTGLLLTRRGESTGFTVYTPRRAATPSARPRTLVLFMATQILEDEARKLVAEGYPRSTPCALVLDAGGVGEEVRPMTLGAVTNLSDDPRPGLFIVGSAATHLWPKLGAFGGRRVLLTCSDAVQEKAATSVEDRGGRPIRWPLIHLRPKAPLPDLHAPLPYDAIVLTSPSSVRIFFESVAGDRRRLPAFYTCGAGTDAELRRYGVASDVVPAEDFSANGLIAEIRRRSLKGLRVLRLRSAKAGSAVARALRKAGATVDDVVLYDTVFCAPTGSLPPFDDVFFASASAVESFLAQYGAGRLRGKGVHVMGQPTRAALPARVAAKAQVLSIV
ncbi:MAG: SAM-dependent methyltransferase [Kiritimatiellia bacterium]